MTKGEISAFIDTISPTGPGGVIKIKKILRELLKQKKEGEIVTVEELEEALLKKQDTLISGENVKTVGGQSIVGKGNIEVGDKDAIKFVLQQLTEAQKVQARANIDAYKKPSTGIPASDIANGVIPDISGKQDTIPDLSTIRSGAAAGATAVQPAALDAKQDVISDLPTIRSGAALGSTSVQPVDIEDMVEAEPIGSIIPPVNPSEFATKEEVSQLRQKVDGSLTLEQGGIAWDGTETARNDRVRTVGFITAPFATETNTGYRLFGIYYYNKETEAFRLYESIDATSWEYNGDEKIRLAFTKTNTEESLSPSDPIIKSVKGGLSYTVEDVKSKADYILYGGQTCVLFKKKNSGTNNKNEFARCKAAGLPILIKDVVDFSLETIDADGCEIVFAPGSMFKNCNIVSANGVKITADKRKIFDKVFFWKWTINGVDCENADIFSAVPKAGLDRYNSVTQSIIPANSTTAVDMLINRFCLLARANFVAPVVVGGRYAYSADGGSTIDFYYEQSGTNISLPIRKDYVFLSKNTSSVLQSTQDVRTKLPSIASYDPSIIIASKLVFPTLVKTAPIKDAILPEWFGAVANDNSKDCRSAIQAAMLAGGVVRLSPNCVYWSDGDIRVFGDTKIEGNNATVKLRASSTAKNLFEIETLSAMQKNIFINDLILDGNKANQSGTQNGIYADFYRGKIPFDGYSVDDTIWTNVTAQNFAGSGICVGTPGTSHIYSSKLQYNGYDGITWDYEHFTLVNVTCWGNGRHGAFASGNHWRIIGGAFAHNGAGDNINCMGAFESQIIGASCIDSGRFVAESGGGYVASSLNPYGYVWAGEGQGTHKLVGGRGIYFHTGTYNMTLIGVRINNQNADGLRVERGRGIVIADCQFNYNNETRNPAFDNVIGVVSISHTYFGDVLKDTGQVPQNFGSNGGVQDWDSLLTTLPIMGEGTVRVSDYFNAANRPISAGSWLEGTVTFKLGMSQTVYRTYIRMMDENGVLFVRYVNINKTTGAYTNDSGWKMIASAN